jgi:hypothetical protein
LAMRLLQCLRDGVSPALRLEFGEVIDRHVSAGAGDGRPCGSARSPGVVEMLPTFRH